MTDWSTLSYSRRGIHQGQRLILDRRAKPRHVIWSQHALARAAERAGWSREQCVAWFQGARYLGRWERNEHWGDANWVASGIRDKKSKGRFTIGTVMPRAYWNFDVVHYGKMMQDLNGD